MSTKGSSGTAAPDRNAIPPHARAAAAAEIVEGIRSLLRIAQRHDLKMVAYLLDMVALEALDCQTKASQTGCGQQR